MDTMALQDLGRMDSLYSSDCSSKSSQQGMDTARALAPSSAAALHASSSSVPVPMQMQSQSSPAAGPATTYAPLRTPSLEVLGRLGTTWRESAKVVGRSVCSTPIWYAPAVSLPSAGRIMSIPGIARKDARCSMGWWVGPSSPTPMESWVITKRVGAPERAAMRMAERM